MNTKTVPACRAVSLAVSLLFAAALSLLTGCVGVMPIPTTSKVEYGSKVTTEQASFIHSGKATRAEVIEKLGTNYTTLPMNKVMAYTWELQGGGGVWWVFSTHNGLGGNWVGGWRGFFVAFDDQDVVKATVFKQLSTRHSVHEQMSQWAPHCPRPWHQCRPLRVPLHRRHLNRQLYLTARI